MFGSYSPLSRLLLLLYRFYAVEVASRSQAASDIAAKTRHDLRGGTRLVWIVWPGRREIDVWRPGNADRPAITLGADDVLDGEDVVPGFTYPVAGVFKDPLG